MNKKIEMNITNKLYPQSFYKDHQLSLEDGKLQATSIGLPGRIRPHEADTSDQNSRSILTPAEKITELFAQKSRELAEAYDHWSGLNQTQRNALRQQVVFLRYNADVFGKFYHGKVLDLNLEPLEKAIGIVSPKVTVQFDNGDHLTVDSKLFEEDCKLFEDLFETISESLVEGNEWNTVPLPLITKEEFEKALYFFNRHQVTASDVETKVKEFQTAAQLMSESYGAAVVDAVAEQAPESLLDLYVANPTFWGLCVIDSATRSATEHTGRLMQKLMQSIQVSTDPDLKEVMLASLIQLFNGSQVTFSALGVEEILNVFEGASDDMLEKLRRLSTGIVDIDEGMHDRLAGLIRRCPNIEELSLAGNGITSRLLDNANFPHLRTFELMPILKLTRQSLRDKGIAGFERSLMSLFSDVDPDIPSTTVLLDLSDRLQIPSFKIIIPKRWFVEFTGSPTGNNEYSLYSFDTFLKKYKTLDIDASNIVLWPQLTHEWFQKLLPFTELRTLRIGKLNSLSEECLDNIQRMPHLKELQINGERLWRFNLLERLGLMANLESLVIFSGYVPDDQLIHLAGLPHLKSLVFSECWGVTDFGIANAGFRDSCTVINDKLQPI